MNKMVEDLKTIEKFSPDMGGVFTLSDIKSLFSFKDINSFYRRLASFEASKVVQRFTRGIYVAERFDLAVASQKICQSSYISFETVLARHLIIGTIPTNTIRAVKIGKKREYKFQNYAISHLGVSKHLFFGFEKINGVNYATKEKALLDTLYFYNKGLPFYFDIYSDIDLSSIDKKTIKKHLAAYKNPKFVKFVKSFLKGK